MSYDRRSYSHCEGSGSQDKSEEAVKGTQQPVGKATDSLIVKQYSKDKDMVSSNGRRAFGVFATRQEAEQALNELKDSGFSIDGTDDQISSAQAIFSDRGIQDWNVYNSPQA